MTYDTVIISDVHLGSDLSLAGELLQFLKKTEFRRLILLGDMFADLNFSRLKREHWAVLSHLREISNPKRNIQVVWVVGNHDLELREVMGHLVGIEVLDRYEWNTDNKRCLAMHGHQFDPAMLGMPGLSKAVSWWFLQLQKIPGFKKAWSRWIDFVSGRFQNLPALIERRALAYARHHHYDVIFCGHTHEAAETQLDGIEYYNSGCWVKETGTYIAIQGDSIRVLEDTHGKSSKSHNQKLPKHR